MLFWKIFAVVDVLLGLAYCYAVWTGSEELERIDWLWMPIWLSGTAGLVCYAFSLQPLPSLFWHYFLLAYVAASGWQITSVIEESAAEMSTYIGIGLGMLHTGLTMVAVHRLGGSGWIKAIEG